MPTSKLLILLIIVFPCLVKAGTWENRRSNLENVVIYNEFRLFYSLSGIDELPTKRRIDLNRNKIPDFIENIGQRLMDSNRFFKYEVGLMSPLKSKRYAGRAHYIDVNVLNFSNNKNGPKNGVAYDGTPKFNRSIVGKPSVNVLAIDISGSVKLKSNSIEHELFHLYQNGYTYFKNRWYTEGTARWSELIINNRVGNRGSLPTTVREKESLFKKTYDANTFWNELMLSADSNTLGKKFIKLLFERLDYVDDIAAKERGISNKDWKESEQRSNKNNLFIWEAAMFVNNRLSEVN